MDPGRPKAGVVLALVTGCCLAALAPSAQADRASQILARARESIGGEGRLRAVRSLTLDADSKVTGGGFVISRDSDGNTRRAELESKGHIKIDVLLPDKFLMTTSGRSSSYRGVNGKVAIVNRDLLPRPILVDPRLLDRLTAQQHRLFMLYTIAFLLMPPDQYGVQFAYDGEADTGTGPADVLQANGPYDLAARLFFEKETGRLQLLAFEQPPRSESVERPRTPAKAGSREAPDASRSAGETPTQAAGTRPLFESLQGPGAPPPVMDRNVRIRCADYRQVDGVLLPYRITTEFGGGIDEWKVSKYRVNPALKPEHFEK